MRVLGRGVPLLLLLLLLLSAPAIKADDEVRRFAVQVPAGDTKLAEGVLQGAFNRWFVASNDAFELTVGAEVSGDVEVVAQTFPVSAALAQRLQGLPVALTGETLVLAGTPYRESQHALAVRVPTEASGPSWVVSGYSAEATAALADRVLLQEAGIRFRQGLEKFDYILWEHRFSQRSGRWQTSDDGVRTAVDARDDPAARAAAYAALKEIRRRHVVLRLPAEWAGLADAALLADDLDQTAAAMVSRIPLTLEEPLEVLVETDFETQGRHLADIGPAVLHDGRLHIVYHPDDFDAFRHGLARALLWRSTALAPLPPWLEDGAALWLSKGWYGRPYIGWLADLAAAAALPSASELLVAERQSDSSMVLWLPAAAALIDRLPGQTLRDKLAPTPTPEIVTRVLARLAATARAPTQPRPRQASSSPRDFHEGVSLAMANGLEVGYHAPGIDEQLARLRRLGVDSVSLMPFAYQPAPDTPELRFLNRSPVSETDVGVVHAARHAHEQGFRVLWKPHIWVSHDSWPGDIAMTGEGDWQAWWRVYRRFVLHHAVLAEWSGSEVFSIGVELGRTVAREAEWRSLIRAVRRLYSGRLTYSGNWAQDFELAPFWDQLDYVGVDAYFPLSDRPDADRAALVTGARRVVARLEAAAERFGRPLILTEVGFAARQGAWMTPHEEGGEVSEEHQAMAWRALLEALGRPPWLAGVYAWKVFSHAAVEGGGRPDFRILGREAEAVLRGYFDPPRPAALHTSQ